MRRKRATRSVKRNPGYIRFYDNDKTQTDLVNRLCDSVEGIHVPEVQVFPEGTSYPEAYIEGARRTRMKVDPYVTITSELGESHGSVVGIADPIYLENLLMWADEDPSNKVVIFDWDRTLSAVEGVLNAPRGKTLADFGIDYTAATMYICGGPRRFTALKSVLDVLDENGVTMFVLTNNAGCLSNKAELLKLIQCLIPTLDEDHLLCSRSAASKVVFLKSNAIFDYDKFDDRDGKLACRRT